MNSFEKEQAWFIDDESPKSKNESKKDDSKSADETPALQTDFKILLVDDEETISRLLSLRLQRHGYQTTVARSGQEALEMQTSQPADLIISDVRMNRGNGLEMIQQLNETGKFTPVIFVSAFNDITPLENYKNKVIATFSKPVRFQSLLNSVKNIESNRELHWTQLQPKISTNVEITTANETINTRTTLLGICGLAIELESLEGKITHGEEALLTITLGKYGRASMKGRTHIDSKNQTAGMEFIDADSFSLGPLSEWIASKLNAIDVVETETDNS